MNRLIAYLAALALAAPASAQHAGHTAPAATGDVARWSHSDVAAYLSAATGLAHEMPATHATGTTARLDHSGTAWLPALAPVEAAHFTRGDWQLMIHGAAFPRYTHQDVFDAGERGAGGAGVPNWVMGMASRAVGARGRVRLKAMMSLDPLTEGGNGYPLLFQSGETFEGERLVDRQHPHDFFSEIAVSYEQLVAPGTHVFGYLGYPGEPVSGPVAFLHRPSARFNPDAPLSHHWHDATHVAFGVATLGVASGPVKVDASVFTGREPDEERWGFDKPLFDSYGLRVTYTPTDRWALHAATSSLTEPETLEPGVDQQRTTASAMYAAPFGADGDLSAALIWGANDLRPDADTDHAAGVQHAFLAEATLRVGRQAVYGRAEYVQKSAEELALEDEEFHDEVFGIGSLTLGAAREVFQMGGLTASLGAQGTLHTVPSLLQPIYGASPVAMQVFLRLGPASTTHP